MVIWSSLNLAHTSVSVRVLYAAKVYADIFRSKGKSRIILKFHLVLIIFLDANFSPTKINSRIVDNFQKQLFDSNIYLLGMIVDPEIWQSLHFFIANKINLIF